MPRKKRSCAKRTGARVIPDGFNDRSLYIRMYEIRAVDSDYRGAYHLSSLVQSLALPSGGRSNLTEKDNARMHRARHAARVLR